MRNRYLIFILLYFTYISSSCLVVFAADTLTTKQALNGQVSQIQKSNLTEKQAQNATVSQIQKNNSDFLTILITVIVLIVNTIALLFVIYQTILIKQSIDEDIKTRQIEMLPRAHFIFEVQYHLKKWIADIEKTTTALKEASDTQDLASLRKISEKALKSPKGLVHKSSYEKGPRWLSEIWLASAQYYYNFNVPLRDLWSDRRQEPLWSLALTLIDLGRNHSHHISSLLGYINQTVPESYAESPARISDNEFLSD